MAQASAEKLEHTGPAEKERVASAPHRAVGKNAGAALAKRKRAVSPKHQIMRGESRWARAAPWRKKGDQSESMERKVDSTVKEGRFQGRKGGQARRASLEQVEGSTTDRDSRT